MRILGLDAGKSSCVGFVLSELPKSIKQNWEIIRKDETLFFDIKADVHGLKLIQSIKPDAIALEPTGGHYTDIYREIAQYLDIKVFWVGGTEIANFRKSNRMPNKSDKADAYAIACYTLLHLDEPEFFLGFDPTVKKLLEKVYQLASLQRIQTPMINRCRQQLAYEWPEVASMKSRTIEDAAPLWKYLNNEKSGWYANRRSLSIAEVLGIEISDFTRYYAARICESQRRELMLRDEIQGILDLPKFQAYKDVFESLGMTLPAQAIVLGKIYPFEQFWRLDAFGRRVWMPKSFRLRLGMGQVTYQSGQKIYKDYGGSSLARKQLFLWVGTKIARTKYKNQRASGVLAQELGFYWDSLEDDCGNKKLAILRNQKTVSKGLRILFRELVKIFLPTLN